MTLKAAQVIGIGIFNNSYFWSVITVSYLYQFLLLNVCDNL